tara:strand:- start:86 stop:454 length:369 start_codon:yes stop_codon:yes gene_type:complete
MSNQIEVLSHIIKIIKSAPDLNENFNENVRIFNRAIRNIDHNDSIDTIEFISTLMSDLVWATIDHCVKNMAYIYVVLAKKDPIHFTMLNDKLGLDSVEMPIKQYMKFDKILELKTWAIITHT